MRHRSTLKEGTCRRLPTEVRRLLPEGNSRVDFALDLAAAPAARGERLTLPKDQRRGGQAAASCNSTVLSELRSTVRKCRYAASTLPSAWIRPGTRSAWDLCANGSFTRMRNNRTASSLSGLGSCRELSQKGSCFSLK